jgi:hypothetical protein
MVAFVDNSKLRGGFLDPSESKVLKVTEGNLDLLAAKKFKRFDKVTLFVKEHVLVDETSKNNREKRKQRKKNNKKQHPSNDADDGLPLEPETTPDTQESSIEPVDMLSKPRSPPLTTSFGFWCDLAISKKDIDTTSNWY